MDERSRELAGGPDATASAATPQPTRASARGAATRTTGPRSTRAWLLLPVGVFCVAVIVVGWRTRDEYYVVPDEGLGYALGIAGLVMMWLLLLYSVRKRWPRIASAGKLQHWFHVHMALGLLGPTAILAHSNFSLGSLNANVALICMLTVSGSGIIGRFIYTRIHYEYRGHIATLADLRVEAESEGTVLAEASRVAPDITGALDGLRAWALAPRGHLARFGMIFQIGMRGRIARRRTVGYWRRANTAGSGPSRREVKRAVTAQVAAIRRVAEFGVYERFFSLWHALHLPFCFGLYVAATVHVVAVHMY